MSFVSYFINGISLGSVHALITLGYTMVYGIAGMLNFAHGDVVMIRGSVVFTAVNSMGLPPVVGIPLAVVVCAVLGVTIERVAYKPLRMAPPLAVLITTTGANYLFQSLALLVFGANSESFPSVATVPAVKLADDQLAISGETIVTIITCAVIMIGLSLFIKRTRTGQAMLAVSEGKDAAQLMGINVSETIALTFTIGSALAAIIEALLYSVYPTPSLYTGTTSSIKAFVAAVLDGIGSTPGAFIGGLLLGVIENLSEAYISSQLSDVIVFDVLILVLLVKPTGILGRKINKEV